MTTAAFCAPFFFTSHRAPSSPATSLSRPPRWVCAAQPPRRIGAVAKDLQEALQSALGARCSRGLIELPAGARLGTEKRPKSEDGNSNGNGNRELARILAGMFEGTGLKVRVIFNCDEHARAARKKWGPLVECAISDWDGGKTPKNQKAKKKKSAGGFGKKAAAEVVPVSKEAGSDENCDVFLIVAPLSSQLPKVKRLSTTWGMDKLILLLNADSNSTNAPVDTVRFVREEFERVYVYRPNPHPQWTGGVLFRKYPDKWVLCRQSAVGMLNELLCQDEEPTLDEIGAKLKDEGAKPGTDILNKITTFLGQ